MSPREEVEAVIAEMRDPQLHVELESTADFLYRQGVGGGSASVDAARRLLREAADRLDATRSTQPEGAVPVEGGQGKRWVLAIEGDRIVGIQYGGSTHWLTNPRMGGYAVVEVMPVAEHEAALAQERETVEELRGAIERVLTAWDEEKHLWPHGGPSLFLKERVWRLRAALAPSSGDGDAA
jgi:hypothetical protein